jgi:hypothetical protein
MSIHIPCVSGPEELFESLRHIDISVPARTEGRLSDHTETWTGARLLSTLARANSLQYPLCAVHRDRPDMLLQSNRLMIGLEITEAISEQYAAYCALAEREFPGATLELALFRWGSPTRTVDEMRELLRNDRLISPPWTGDSAEQEWALFIKSVIDNKLGKLAQPGFGKFDKNWLAIYDNLPLPNVHLGKAISFLVPLLETSLALTPTFDAIFIERGTVIARITAEDSEHLVIHDLW